jgi:hypothetical protein
MSRPWVPVTAALALAVIAGSLALPWFGAHNEARRETAGRVVLQREPVRLGPVAQLPGAASVQPVPAGGEPPAATGALVASDAGATAVPTRSSITPKTSSSSSTRSSSSAGARPFRGRPPRGARRPSSRSEAGAMKLAFLRSVLLAAALLALAVPVRAQTALSALQTDVDQVTKKARASVVTVFAQRTATVRGARDSSRGAGSTPAWARASRSTMN